VSEKPKCVAEVTDPSGWHRWKCGKTAKVEHEGKHYCGTHDPVKLAARRAEKAAKWNAQWASQDAARNEARRIVAELGCGSASSEGVRLSLDEARELARLLSTLKCDVGRLEAK